MSRKFTDDELQQRRDALRALDAQGQGLKSARFRQLLEELGNYFTRTAQSLDRADEKLKSKRAEFGLNEPVPPKRDADEPQSNVLNKFRKNLNMDQKEEKQKTAEELNQERQAFRGLNA